MKQCLKDALNLHLNVIRVPFSYSVLVTSFTCKSMVLVIEKLNFNVWILDYNNTCDGNYLIPFESRCNHYDAGNMS